MRTYDPNRGFICPVCGRNELVPSTLIMQGNYGSKHDTERVMVKLCADCFDGLYTIIQSKLPEEAIELEFTL